MKVLGVIPARFNSTRFPGKPLADILGRPMLAWVYEAASKAKKLSELIVATDDERIAKVCKAMKIPAIITQQHHSAICRIHEVSKRIDADLFIQINGDEPLIKAQHIEKIIPKEIDVNMEFASQIICKIKSPTELMDNSNIKVIFDKNMNTIYMSRTVIPTAFKSLNFSYYKHVGILAYNKKCLDFFAYSKPLKYEIIEGLETLRFIEHEKKLLCKEIYSHIGLSVDTLKDLERVKSILRKGK